MKPGNVLLGPDGRVVLTDFGIARASGSPALTMSGVLVGSPSYISPERARGGQAGTAGDLWALGASLYAAVEGLPPFDRDGVLASLTAVVTDDPDPSTRTGPLQPVISGLLRKDPGTRLGADEVEQMLRRVADGEAPTAEQQAVAGPEAPAGHRQSDTAALAAPVPDPEPAAGPGPGGVLAGERPWPDDPAGPPEPEPQAPEPAQQAPQSEPEPAEPRPESQPAEPEPESRLAQPEPESRLAQPEREPGPTPPPAPPEAGPLPQAGPPTGPMPPAPAPEGTHPGHRRSHLVLGALAAAAVIAVIAVIVALASPSSPAHRSASPPSPTHPAPTASAPRSTSPSPASSSAPASPSSGTPGSGTGQLPAGYYRFTNSTGFSIGVPAGWQISHSGHYVYIQDPSAPGVYLLIDQSNTPKPNPLADWEQQAASRQGTYPGYHLLRLQSVRYPQAEKAADWEFTYDRNGQAVQVLNRNVLANADHAYALYWTTPESAWNADYHYFQAFAGTFRPAGVNQTG